MHAENNSFQTSSVIGEEETDNLINMSPVEYRSIDEVIGDVEFNRFHYWLLCLCGLGFCADAMEVVSLSFINPCAGAEWQLMDEEIAVRVCLCIFGIVLITPRPLIISNPLNQITKLLIIGYHKCSFCRTSIGLIVLGTLCRCLRS